MKQRDRVASFGAVPGCEDVDIVLDKQKNGKAAGSLGILAEMLKVYRQKCEGFEAICLQIL